ncbi:hypothetical protein Rsub_01848 [Raphidocelis subcapitata]|uniref:MYND-type domain-containing protein n=1 Tax=Raphidocelis subcapitata TaxID=307507 RepID=A0A2V0NNH8_9CHLO|nr:hypothetical protein Rsub_01848 [Raphidocelis subcapitata]|eukprot:GBF89131.1 hypothetical protein Rsub_01848 [Raphidocelis subcapitata]
MAAAPGVLPLLLRDAASYDHRNAYIALTALKTICALGAPEARQVAAAPGAVEALAAALRRWRSSLDGERLLAFHSAADALASIARADAAHAQKVAAAVPDMLQLLVGALASGDRGGESAAVDAAVCALSAAATEAPGAVAAALAAPSSGPRARALLQQPPLSLPAEAAGALALAASKEAALQSRVAVLGALAAAAGGEAEAARPEACVACGQEAGPGMRLKPCTGCAGGPAGRVLYCGAACQRADWKRHKAFCKLAAAAAKDDAAAGPSEDC